MAGKAAQDVVNSIVEQYRKRTPRSRELDLKAKQSLPGGDSRTGMYFTPYPTYIERGKGFTISDYDGNSYIDFHNNATSLIHGHCYPPIVEAVREQLARGTAFGLPCTEPAIRHAEIMKGRVPGLDLVRYCNSGNEATLGCIQAARAYTKRDMLIKMDGGYHGVHEAVAVNVTPDTESKQPPVLRAESRGTPLSALGDLIVVDFNDLDAVELALKAHPGKVAAIILEPMLFGGGLIPRKPGFLRGVRTLADRYGVLLILDEVVTFRMSLGGFQVIDEVKPDLTAFGKIVAGGYPGALFGGRKDVMMVYDPLAPGHISQGGTFNANNLVMAAGIAALEHYGQREVDRVNALGDRLRKGMNDAFVEARIRGQVTGLGSVVQSHFTDKPIVNARDAALARKAAGECNRLLHLELLNRGVFPASRCFHVVSTPMTVKEIDKALEAFAQTLGVLKPYIADAAPQLMV